MRHGYIVLDNDAPLCICESRAKAEAVIVREERRLRAEFEKTVPLGASHEEWVTNRFEAHYLHWVMAPIVSVNEESR